ncbi:MAG: hypothetical protein FWE07_00735 [Turicibacter sp.]|nr:hypothetical protein [Turicibacter sp.]
MITFGLYGSGWRSEFFLHVAKLLPKQFCIDGVITTNPEKAAYFNKEFDVTSYGTLDEYLTENTPLFIVESVNKGVSATVTMNIVNKGFPVLMETPAGKDIETMIALSKEVANGAKIQIAEQYPFHPLHAARQNIIADHKLGNIQHTQVSFSHGYHGIALIRKFLGIGFENVEISAVSFPTSVANGVTRDGEPTEDKMNKKIQTIATLKFENGQTALYNFEMDQHRSWVRTPIIQIKGDRGEIFGETVKYLLDYKTPIESEIRRVTLGENQNVEGFGLKGLVAANTWYYKNPYPNSRLTDDEIAVAMCLEKMAHYVATGESFYSFAEGAQDMYLGMMIEEAAACKKPITTETMPWVSAN